MENRERNEHLQSIDQRHVWHPFTQMREWAEQEPLIIERAEGNYLIDTQGRRYLDGVSSLWANLHGHNRREINQAIVAQLEQVAHTTLLGLTNIPATRLAERLVAIAPGNLDKVFYSDSGSTAVEIALKQAFQYWQHRGKPTKQRFIHLMDAYHGDTLGAVGVGGIQLFHELFAPLLVDSYSVPTPHRCREGSDSPQQARDRALSHLEFLLRIRSHEIAACIIEPLVQGAAGIFIQPKGYVSGVAHLCRKYDVLLIADEVATGFGRTGAMFACDHEGIAPDLLCLAKGLSGGYLPLAATLATNEIYEAFLGQRQEAKTFYHGHTFTGNPLACAAALASLELFVSDRVFEKLAAKIEHLHGLLMKQLAPLPAVQEIRQQGLMVGIELGSPTGLDHSPGFMGARVCRAVRDQGVILRPLADVVVVMPPLSTKLEELNQLVDAIEFAIRTVCE